MNIGDQFIIEIPKSIIQEFTNKVMREISSTPRIPWEDFATPLDAYEWARANAFRMTMPDDRTIKVWGHRRGLHAYVRM